MPETTIAEPLSPLQRRRDRSDRVIRTGAVLTVAGILFTLIALLPLVSDVELPSAWWFLSMLTGVGLATILVGLTLSARSRRM